jgi:hypothetical protein
MFNYPESDNSGSLNTSNDNSPTIYSGIGEALDITSYGTGNFENNFINTTNNEKVSFLVPNNWNATQVTSNISKIYDYEAKWIEDNFNNGYNNVSWTNHTSGSAPDDYITFGWYNATNLQNNSLYLMCEQTAGQTYNRDDIYWNYTFNLPREHIAFTKWYLDFNYKFEFTDPNWLPKTGGTNLYASIIINGVEAQFSQQDLDLVENKTLYNDNIDSFTVEQFGLSTPGQVSLKLGLYYGNVNINPPGYVKLFFDNISLRFSTFAKPSQLNLTITDQTNDQSLFIQDSIGEYLGTACFINKWTGAVGGKYHYFTFASNSTGDVIIDTTLYVEAKNIFKSTTETNIQGSDYYVENNSVSTWNTYFPVSIPGSYDTNYYINFSKPLNWNITQLIDPYENNRVDEINETAGFGNTSVIIPNNVLSNLNGKWKIVANSPNYVKDTKIFNLLNSNWIENSTFQASELIKINASIKDALVPDITKTFASLSIYAPDNSLWYSQDNVSPDLNGNVLFEEIEFNANNASVGKYAVEIQWNNNNSKISQVGIYSLEFTISHNSVLTRSNFHESSLLTAFSGDFVLIKVNYSDIDLNNGISNGFVNFTIDNTTKIQGEMTYQGGGIYLAEIHMVDLERDLYNVTVSAQKSYYQSQNDILLFKIDIQLRTSLKRYESPTFVQLKENITVKYQYKDQNGIGVAGASISLNIGNEHIHSISYLGDGNYSVTFSSTAFGSIGTHSVTFTFGAIGFENKTNFYQFDVIQQSVNLELKINSDPINETELLELNFKQTINLSVRAYALVENKYLTGGEMTFVGGSAPKVLTESPPTYYNISILIDSTNFSAGINYVYLKFQKTNYSTETFSFQLYIRQQTINLSVTMNSQIIQENSLIELFFKQNINFSVRAYATVEEKYLSGGTITFISDYWEYNFTESPNTYFNATFILNRSYFDPGVNYIYIQFQQEDYTSQLFSFQLYLREQDVNLTVMVNSQIIQENTLVYTTFRENINISVRAFAAIEKIYLGGGIVTFISDRYQQNLTESKITYYNYSISINLDNFDPGLSYVQLLFEEAGYESTIFKFQIQIQKVKIQVVPIDFEGTIETFNDRNLKIQINLLDQSTGGPIQNATVYYEWDYGLGTMNEISSGLYECTIRIPNVVGSFEFEITVSVGSIYERIEVSFFLVVSAPPTPPTALLAGFITLIAVAGVLSVVVIRSFIYKPIVNRKRRKFQEKIQPFKDVRNIIGINIVHKNVGITLFSKKYSFLKEQDDTLFSGFIQAIMIFGEKVSEIDQEKLLKKEKDSKEQRVLELDFKFFYILIVDYEELRVILILRKNASERLKKQTQKLAKQAYLEVSDELKEFKGVISPFRKIIEPIVNDLLLLHYKEPFEITDDMSFFLKTKETRGLSAMETRIVNVLNIYMQDRDQIQLQDIFDLTTEKNTDIIIEAIQSLINRNYLVPASEN